MPKLEDSAYVFQHAILLQQAADLIDSAEHSIKPSNLHCSVDFLNNFLLIAQSGREESEKSQEFHFHSARCGNEIDLTLRQL
jgi:hypothetical protein